MTIGLLTSETKAKKQRLLLKRRLIEGQCHIRKFNHGAPLFHIIQVHPFNFSSSYFIQKFCIQTYNPKISPLISYFLINQACEALEESDVQSPWSGSTGPIYTLQLFLGKYTFRS
jgi:hypothetical protein